MKTKLCYCLSFQRLNKEYLRQLSEMTLCSMTFAFHSFYENEIESVVACHQFISKCPFLHLFSKWIFARYCNVPLKMVQALLTTVTRGKNKNNNNLYCFEIRNKERFNTFLFCASHLLNENGLCNHRLL